jgi:hypothetical protein
MFLIKTAMNAGTSIMIELSFRSPLAGQPRNMAKLLPNKFKNLLGAQ